MSALRFTVLPTPIPDMRETHGAGWMPRPLRARACPAPPDHGTSRDLWFLGATGRIAHRPHTTGVLTELLRQRDGRGLPPEISACGVLLTRTIAGPDVELCELCLLAITPATREQPMT